MTFRFWLTLLLLGAWLLPLAPPPAPAYAAPAGGQVGDGTPGSCTESALENKLAGGGALTFACGGPLSIFLTSAKSITTTTTLDGSGGITLDGSGSVAIFTVSPSVSLTLRNISLNNANGGASDGGAIKNHGTLILDHATIQGSRTDDNHSGGAIFSDGPLVIHDSLFQGNQAGSAGALFANFALARVTITDTTFTHNHAYNGLTGYGGAIWVGQQAQVSISGGTIFSNSAKFGGGVYLSANGVFTLTATGGPALLSSNVVTSAGGGLYNSAGQVTLGHALLNGNVAPGNGGAIDNVGGQLTLTDATLSGNVGGTGGGLTNEQAAGALTLTRVALTGNRAVFGGGGLDNNGGAARLSEVVIRGNTVTNTFSSPTYGGGIENYGTLTLTNSTVSGNSAANNLNSLSFGGGVYNNQYTDQDSLTLINTTVSGNASAGDGAGILNVGTLTLTNSTLSDNVAAGQGGGLENYQGTARLNSVTLSGNSASTGGGLFQQSLAPTHTLTLQNTLVASGASGANCYEDPGSVGSLISNGYNLSSEGTCAAYFNQTGDVNNHYPNLGPLANHGGPTFTQLPSPPSLAIDAIPLGANGCGTTLTTDQRGAPRPIHGQCDIGAAEAGWPFPQLWLAFIRR